MRIKVCGRSAGVDTDTVCRAVEFYGEYLMGSRLSKNINITIEFSKFKKGSDEYAFVDYELDESRLRDFVLSVDSKLSKKETLLALAHEMVHVKQYAKGEMRDLFRPMRMVRWKGERILHEEMDYWELPWEIEAYGREKGLYIKFISSEL